MLQQAVRLLVGGELRYVKLPPALSESIEVLGVPVPHYRVFLFCASLALFALTWLLMYKTDRDEAAGDYPGSLHRLVLRHRRDNVYGFTFAYGAALAGLAGALVSPLKSVSPEMGTGYVVDAFMVVVLGGVQSLVGTVASAFMLGELAGVIAFLQNDTVAKALVFLAIVVLIRFRPQGLFASRVRGMTDVLARRGPRILVPSRANSR